MKKRVCKFGDRCKFSHDVPTQQQSSRPRPPDPPGAGHDGKLRQWKRLLNLGDLGWNSPELTTTAASQFFQLGLDMMDGDVGAAQDTIKLLAKDAGLSFVKALAERHIPRADTVNTITLWETEMKPLFSLVTHPRVVDSAVLEQQVADIFNFMLGVQGQRMTRIFNFVLQLVTQSALFTQGNSRMEALELSVSVLASVIDCNTKNIVNPECERLVSIFAQIVKNESDEKDSLSHLQASKYVEYMQQRLDTGKTIADLKPSSHISLTKEDFVIQSDLPGTLSADGPRHDNDHTNINKIKILPTYEEVMSPRGEYLPTKNPSKWHINGIRGRLDREFRLVREDTVGQLRDAVRDMLEVARNPNLSKTRNSDSIRTYTYENPFTIDVDLHRIGGLEMVVCCNQLPAVSRLNTKKRKDWWIQSKRLQAGGLVCLFDVTGSMPFCVVSDTTMRFQDDKDARKIFDKDEDEASGSQARSLSHDEAFLFVNLKPVDPTPIEITQAMRWYKPVKSSPRRYLVEFPGILLDSFKHTLSALQKMYEQPNIPFKNLLAPKEGSKSDLEVVLPLYTRKAGFTFDLSCLTRDKTPLTVDPRLPITPQELTLKSSLDPTQSAALLSTLTRELSLVQGPPGTGKSYTGEKIIKVLLQSRKGAKLGPILCVCYTNHALDQLLEHLLDDGTKSVIRIGSRSKSERLQNLNLRNVAKEMFLTKSEKSGLWEAEQQIREHVRDGKDLLKELAGCQSWRFIKALLALDYPRQHVELFGENQEGWQTVIHQPEMVIDRWLQSGHHNTAQARQLEHLKLAPLYSLTKHERTLLHRHWVQAIRDPIIARLARLNQKYDDAVKHKDEIRGDVDLRCLNGADVIGVTTTGLARNLNLMRKLRCKIMLCEEAGEVLEAHTLTALLPSIEHAILIGDHLQLRPQIQNYGLQSTNPRGRQYSLDVSLFERLVQSQHETDFRIPYSVLETQRRMHPSIAELVRTTLYPSLNDAKTVEDYPQVVGMKRRLFWLHHDQPENTSENNDYLSTSRSNSFEVDMTAALVSHLSQQGTYRPGDIAVLTPYLGQLQLLRRRMESMFEIYVNDRDQDDLEAFQDEACDSKRPRVVPLSKTTLLKSVRVATVDNFQGEEAKVIVISLVRSNSQGDCGFLKTSNRINVLLSRAKHGMYIIGNSNSYKQVPMWTEVMKILSSAENLGTKLELQCTRHPDTAILVSHPDHFLQFSPESGCNLACDKRLLCGHPCTGRCHSDALHHAVKCLAACPRLKKGCNHTCPLRCGDACHAKCQTILEHANLLLPCGHRLPSPRCWETQEVTSIRCMETVMKKVPGCDHEVRVKCHQDVTADEYQCTAPCGRHRICGHTCIFTCFRCNTRKGGKITEQNHGICSQRCGRNFSTCQHSCSQSCHGDAPCQPCRARCEVRCSHSRCSKACYEPCVPCAQATCSSSCVHSKCTAPCAAPCNWVPCSLRCEKTLDCGHQCPSLCGEICPASKFCQVCASGEIKSACVDFLEMKEYREIDLGQEPCIFPDCGHFLTVSSMDGQMDMAANYKLDTSGLPDQVLRCSKPFSMDNMGVKTCATCRGPLRNVSRYGRIVRRAMLDEATKKFISWSNNEYRSLSAKLITEQECLTDMGITVVRDRKAGAAGSLTVGGSRQRQLQIVKNYMDKRYDAILNTRKSIQSYATKVQKEEQPFHRVADLVRHANLLHQGGQNEFRYDQSVIQAKGSLLASTLLLKCDMLILTDFFPLLLSKTSKLAKQDIKLDLSCFMHDCDTLLQDAKSAVYPREQAQGHIFHAQLCAFSCSMVSTPPGSTPQKAEASSSTSPNSAERLEQLRNEGLKHISQARRLLEEHPSANAVKNEIDAAEEALNGGIYRPVTAEELRQVYTASLGELSGTGHWYTCPHGHPFTINRCGMAMEEATCPECGARIGGQNHVSVEGVRHAVEIEEIGREMEGIQL